MLSLDILVTLTRPQMMDNSQIMRCPGIIKTSHTAVQWRGGDQLYKEILSLEISVGNVYTSYGDKPFVDKIINTRNYINI